MKICSHLWIARCIRPTQWQEPSRDPQQEAYRLLLVAVCNSLQRGDALHVRADRGLHRIAHARGPAVRELNPLRYAGSHDS